MPLQRRKAMCSLHLRLNGHGQPQALPYVPYTPPVFLAFSKHNPEMDLLKAEGLFFRPSEGSLPRYLDVSTPACPTFLARGPALKLITDFPILRTRPRPDNIRSPSLSMPTIYARSKGPLNSHPVCADIEPLRIRPQAIRHTSPPIDFSILATPGDVLAIPAEATEMQHATRTDLQVLLATLPPRPIAGDVAREESREIVKPKCGRIIKNIVAHARESVLVERERRQAEHSSTKGGQIPRAFVSNTIACNPLSANAPVREMDAIPNKALEDEFASAGYMESMAEVGIAVEAHGVWGFVGDRANGWNEAHYVVKERHEEKHVSQRVIRT